MKKINNNLNITLSILLILAVGMLISMTFLTAVDPNQINQQFDKYCNGTSHIEVIQHAKGYGYCNNPSKKIFFNCELVDYFNTKCTFYEA